MTKKEDACEMVKRLARYIGEYKRETILTPVMMLGEVAMEVVVPLLMASMIDNGIELGNMGTVVSTGLMLIVCVLISLTFGILGARFGSKAAAGFSRNLTKGMYYNVQTFSFNNIDKFSTSSLVTRMTTDVNNVQMAFMMIIRVAARGPAMLIFATIMSFSVNPDIAVVFLIAIPILGGGLYFIIRKAHPIFERVFKTYDKLNNVVQENLRGIRVVKSFNREAHEEEKMGAISNTIYKDFVKAEKIVAFNTPLMQTSIYTCIILVSWIGGRMIVGGSMTTGQLMSMISYAGQILMSLMMLSFVLVMITIARASAERIDEVLSEKTDIQNPPHPIMTVKDGSIDFDHVNFSYKKTASKLCLNDMNLHIHSGSTGGIIGGTGSAKSTLVQLVPRLYDPTAGSVKVGGLDTREYDIEALREAVAMVLQKNVLFSGTVKENLRWGNESATDEEIREVCKLAQADGFVSEMPEGYDTYIEQGGTNVSGGQKQRLCIARALLKKPKILILDDSTSAVDTKTDALIRQAFAEKIPDTTKLIIAQRISSVQEADMIIVMDDGKISAVGKHDELMKKSAIYREVYESQMKGGEEDGQN